MDLATLIGFVAGIAIFLWALILGSNGNVGGFWDMPSVIMVGGGGIATTLLSVRLERFLAFASIVRNAFFVRHQTVHQLIESFVKWAEIARRDGILALERVLPEVHDGFIENGLRMAIDGIEPAALQQTLEAQMAALDFRHSEGKQVLDLLGKYAPAFGMIGTLVGLVVMLQNMDDPKKIGPGMAVALLTTLYGSIIANMICLPLSDKLNNRHNQEVLRLTIAMAGIMGIQSGDSPRILKSKLAVYLSDRMRQKLGIE